jgi:uracil phosphoribosyltransferase
MLSPVLHLVSHPVAHDCLAQLRDASTPSDRFRLLTERISVVIAAEALASLPSRPVPVTTPLAETTGQRIGVDVVVVPVMRAGLAMLPGLLHLVPEARVGFIGLKRNEETAVASRYFERLPEGLADSHVFVIDPMLATGGSAIDAIRLLREAGARHISLLCIVAAPEGVQAVDAAFPDVPLFCPAVDTALNARKFIVPGLGDFGDRLYGTT